MPESCRSCTRARLRTVCEQRVLACAAATVPARFGRSAVGSPGPGGHHGRCRIAGRGKLPRSSQPLAPSAPAARTAQQGDAQQPVFRGGIDFVRVDVIVSDKKAQPVTDLTQADFEVLEDGKPQSIEQFRLIKVDGNRSRAIRRQADSQPQRRGDRGRARRRADLRVLPRRLSRAARRTRCRCASPLTEFIQTAAAADRHGRRSCIR